MILSICPNPSIDCTIELDNLNVGMLNRIESKVETYSGKALNVAIGVSRLEENSFATGFMFENHKRMFEHNLDKEGVKHEFVLNGGSARTNYKIIDKKSMLTEINDRGEEVSRDKQKELIDLAGRLSVDAEVTVMSGSLPKGVSCEFYGEVLSALKSETKVIVDAERNNVLQAIKARPVYMVKPNLKELESFSEMKVRSKKDILSASRKYLDMGVNYVLVSIGSEGAVLTNGVENYYCKSASVAVNSTVGAGDSMVAACSVGLIHGVSDSELLRRAVAAGTAAVTTSGTNLFYKDKYREIYSKISVEKF